jgi:hypothetical protein
MNLDCTGLFAALLIVGVALGLALDWVAPWLWGLLKPLRHAVTA